MRGRKRRQSTSDFYQWRAGPSLGGCQERLGRARYHRRMRKLLAWLVVTIGIAALVRKLRRRREAEAEPVEGAPEAPAAEPAGEDPADALRRKLASTREESGGHEGATGEPEESFEERRAGVHEQGRAAIDEMQRSTEE